MEDEFLWKNFEDLHWFKKWFFNVFLPINFGREANRNGGRRERNRKNKRERRRGFSRGRGEGEEKEGNWSSGAKVLVKGKKGDKRSFLGFGFGRMCGVIFFILPLLINFHNCNSF